MKTYFYFPIRECTAATHRATDNINWLANSKNSFNLSFDQDYPNRIRVQTQTGNISRASFNLLERTPSIENQVNDFNSLLVKNPIVLAVAIQDTVCITVVTED